jgi:hypothetical protein
VTANLVSPNEMLQKGKDLMLDGRDIVSAEDAMRVMNFIACNAAAGLEFQICMLMKRIYRDEFDQLTDDDIVRIAEFQAERK